jgi:hypothetical protein
MGSIRLNRAFGRATIEKFRSEGNGGLEKEGGGGPKEPGLFPVVEMNNFFMICFRADRPWNLFKK